jgi:ketosteroid isomerase-like protein
MRKHSITIAGIMIGIICILGVKTAQSRQTPADDMTQLRALNAKFIHNFVTNDVPSHDAILHEKFEFINSKGKWVNREDYLENWKTGFDPERIVYWDYRFERITIIGTTALVRSVNKCTILNKGKETTDMTQYTDTYVKENGAWRCIQAQITVVAPENYPTDETIVKKYINGKIQQ